MSRPDTLPASSLLNGYRHAEDFLDVFSVSLKARKDLQDIDIRVLADHVLNADIGWMKRLVAARDAVVKPLGMKTTEALALDQSDLPTNEKKAGDRISFFKIYSVRPTEIILGEDDWHQDFRLSIFRSDGENPRVYASTCCKRHNLFGHVYLALILPFHKKIALSVLDTAVEQKLAA